MAGAAGRIDDAQREQRVDGVFRLALRAIEHGIERGVEQRLNEAVRRVVAAGRLARVALRLRALGEQEGAAVVGDARRQLQQALVDGAQLLRLHVAPIDRRQRRARP